jgi:hypothetical protein
MERAYASTISRHDRCSAGGLQLGRRGLVRDSRAARARLIRLLPALVVAGGCTQTNPPPQYPQYQPPQAAQEVPPAQPEPSVGPAEPPAPLAPPAPPAEPLPIDPAKDMPKDSLTTDAKLSLDREASVMIDSRSDVFSATMKKADGSRGGVLPSTITLAKGGGVVKFSKVVGKAGCSGEGGFGPDGGDCAGGNTDLKPAGKIAGIIAHDRTLFLVGVFVGAKLPAKAPPVLDFSPDKQGTGFKELAPALGQVFFVGDGLTGTGSGDPQAFRIPAGATHLYLGYADGFGFQGTPGYYADNKGGLEVSLVQTAK